MKYYLVYTNMVMRGNPDDVTTFEVCKNDNWEQDFDLGWRFLYGDLIDYQEITQSEAEKLIA